jgi:hypothetical protein
MEEKEPKDPNIIEESIDRLWFYDGDSRDEVDLFLNSDGVLELDVEGEQMYKGLRNNQAQLKLNRNSIEKLSMFLNRIIEGPKS